MPDDRAQASLQALAKSPSLIHALEISTAIERGTLAAADVASVLARISEVSLATEMLRAVIDRQVGLAASSHADTVARLVPTSGAPWHHALEALWQVHELAYDGAALVAATNAIVPHDRYHRRALQMAMRAAQIAGEPVESIEVDLAIADGVATPYQRMLEQPAAWTKVLDSLHGLVLLRRGLAWRVIQRAALAPPPAGLFVWAAGELREERAVVTSAFAQLPPAVQHDVLAVTERPDHPLVASLMDALATERNPDVLANVYAALASAGMHRDLMSRLVARRDARGAGCYAYALAELVKKAPTVVELARAVCDWKPATGEARPFLKYALVAGARAALDARDYEIVRRCHAAAERIAEPVVARWTNPLDAVPDQLARALSGEADTERQMLVADCEAARKKGKPLVRIGDDALGELGRTTVRQRLQHDRKTGEVWFVDADDRVRYFDGYSVANTPFEGAIPEIAEKPKARPKPEPKPKPTPKSTPKAKSNVIPKGKAKARKPR